MTLGNPFQMGVAALQGEIEYPFEIGAATLLGDIGKSLSRPLFWVKLGISLKQEWPLSSAYSFEIGVAALLGEIGYSF